MMDKTPGGSVRQLSLLEAAIPIVGLIILAALSYYLFGDAGAKGPNQVALLMAMVLALYIGRRAGHTIDALSEAAVASVGTGGCSRVLSIVAGWRRWSCRVRSEIRPRLPRP
jgi:NhaC family Na+:H+ antiporter